MRTGALRSSVQHGFSLLEVLIAVVVLAIGLLGLAGLQFSSLRNNNQSYERSQAHMLAYQIADSMRASRAAAAAGAFVMGPAALPGAFAVDCRVDRCTEAEAAQFQLFQWYERLQSTLPGSTARITCSVAPCQPGVMHTVQVIWDENRTGLAPTNATANACPATSTPTTHLACVQISLLP